MKTFLVFNDIAIDSVKGNYYKIHFWYMREDEIVIILRTVKQKQNSIMKIAKKI